MREARRPAHLLVLLATLVAVAATLDGPARAQRPGESRPAEVSADPPAAEWAEVERLVGEQKYEAAGEIVGRIREAAQARGEAEEWARALAEETALRMGLHGYETAVRFLREQPWPEDPLQRAALNLVYARSLVNYVQTYSWEIRQRERVEAKGEVDLKAWTADQIAAEARRAFVAAWEQREELGDLPVSRLSRFLVPNTYPTEVRGTLRDAVSYLFVELLADSSLWSPAESNDLFRIDFDTLLEGDPAASATLKLDNPAVHPLVALGAVLDDLETWHTRDGRPEAALEARLERARRLHAAFTDAPKRASIQADLEKRLPGFREVPWWAEGKATLAELVRQDPGEGALIRARALALEGRQAYPESVGGQHCLSIQKSIEAPDYQLASMTHDNLGRRSIQVTHRNLAALHFRAYAVGLIPFIEAQQDARLLPAYQEIEKIVAGQTPVASWSEELPETPDFRSHRTFVTPPVKRAGLHVIVASARKDFAEGDNRLQAVNLVASDLVLVTRLEGGGIEVAAVSGSTGAPVAGAQVTLYRADWQKGHARVATLETPARGVVTFRHTEARRRHGHFVVARRGDDVAVDTSFVHFWPESRPGERTASLLYTDRSVYRPLQTVHFKVVVFHGGGERARFTTRPETAVTVTLVDPNNETVETRSLTTNAFGSASGEFTIPSGRLLGRWTVRSSIEGAATIRVEEYKRPTFEAKLLEPDDALRLNREATLRGEARYYFGLPVAGGEVRWRVVRESVYPWWWGLWGRGGGSSGTQTIAAGTAALDADGLFRFSFTPEAGEEGRAVTYRYSATADVTDEGGETRSATRGFRLGHVAIEAAIQPPAAFLQSGEAAEVSVVRSDLDGVGRAGKASWRLVAMRQPDETILPADQPRPSDPPEAYRTPGDALRARWDTHVSHEAVLRSWADGKEYARGALAHDDKGRATVELPGLAWVSTPPMNTRSPLKSRARRSASMPRAFA